MAGCVDYLKTMRPDINDVTIIQCPGNGEKLRFLIEIFPPRGPVIAGIDEMLTNLMDGNVTAGFVLNGFIAADMVAVTMGAENQADVSQFYVKIIYPPAGFIEVRNICRVN